MLAEQEQKPTPSPASVLAAKRLQDSHRQMLEHIAHLNKQATCGDPERQRVLSQSHAAATEMLATISREIEKANQIVREPGAQALTKKAVSASTLATKFRY